MEHVHSASTVWLLRCTLVLPVLVAVALAPAVAFGVFLLMSFVAALAPGFDRLCATTPFRYLPVTKALTALMLALLWSGALAFGLYLLVPLLLQGGTEAWTNTQKILQELPRDFSSAWQSHGEVLRACGVTKEMFDKATEWITSHSQSLIGPGAAMAQWFAHTVMKGTVGVISFATVPFLILFLLWWWDYECMMVRAVVETLLPPKGATLVNAGWAHFNELSGKLFKAMGTSMLIFSGVFIAVLLVCKALGYNITVARAVFDGLILGITGGIPVFGGIINYVTITLICLVNFGADPQILTVLLLVTFIVHKLEVSMVTPWMVGTHLEFSSIGLLVAFLTGFVCWGPTMHGIGMSLFLLPFFRAMKSLIDLAVPVTPMPAPEQSSPERTEATPLS
ncbi:MAG: hypothetical protein KBE09_04660 [Candidatus Pacebacteria bacterium]|nr:hypothetical protein [Candidatus Paceibacterota bacterium]